MNKRTISLIDLIESPNKLLKHSATPTGIRFTFADKKLPPWFFQLAHRFGYAVEDRTRSGSRGRVVSLIDDSGRDRQSYHPDPDHVSNS